MSNAGGFKSLNRYYDMLAGNTVWNPWSPDGAFDALSTVTVPSGGLASIDFVGIPNTYKHLQIRCIENITNSFNDQGYSSLQFNGDTTSSYSRHQLTGDGSSSGAYGAGSLTNAVYGFAYLVNATSSYMAANIIDVLDYSSSTKTKTIRSLNGMDFNGSGFLGLFSGGWFKTEPVTSIKLFNTTGSFRQNSTFSLYGVK
jgi:hypothetical protein